MKRWLHETRKKIMSPLKGILLKNIKRSSLVQKHKSKQNEMSGHL